MDMNQSLLEMNNALLTMILHMLVTERYMGKKKELLDGDADRYCAYCTFESSAQGEANILRSVSAHIRQMHPDQWRHIRSVNQLK